MVSDPIADFLFRIKNAYLADKKILSIPYSKMKERLAKVLAKKGFIEEVKVEPVTSSTKFKKIKITLKYKGKKPALTEVKRISKPGVRIYVKKEKIHRVLSGLGVLILSTSKGLMTGEEARRKGLGGEVICEMW